MNITLQFVGSQASGIEYRGRLLAWGAELLDKDFENDNSGSSQLASPGRESPGKSKGTGDEVFELRTLPSIRCL